MGLAVWMAVQATAAAASATGLAAPIDFDLAELPAGAGEDAFRIGCRRGGDSDEIVVCARRRGGNYPMDEMARRYAFKPLVAETGIAPDTSLRAYTEQVEFGSGQVSKRAMVGVKLRF